MKFCPECGRDLKGSKRFCPECGFNVQILQSKGRQAGLDDEPAFDEILSEQNVQNTSRDMGSRLEDMVEKILMEWGFETETRKKIRGNSDQLCEIDIMARRDGLTMAVECKNYAQIKIGIKDIRDFSAKLDDLNIRRGLFVTSSSFSQDAAGWAANNPHAIQIDLWDGDRLAENFQNTMLGRTGVQSVKVTDSLAPRDTIGNYSDVFLKNSDLVRISRRELIFYPYYIVQFTLREQFKTPDRQVHSQFNSGQYIVDGLTKKILYCADDNKKIFFEKDKENKHIIKELTSIEPQKMLVVQRSENSKIDIKDSGISTREIEFAVRKKAIKDNKKTVPYSIKKSKGEEVRKRYTHTPSPNSTRLQSKMVRVPKIEIVFVSKEHTYHRRILAASDVTLTDEISECRHLLRKKDTFAVCQICGIAKCEDDIFVDEQDGCFCKDHASQTLRESKKKTLKDRISDSFRLK